MESNLSILWRRVRGPTTPDTVHVPAGGPTMDTRKWSRLKTENPFTGPRTPRTEPLVTRTEEKPHDKFSFTLPWSHIKTCSHFSLAVLSFKLPLTRYSLHPQEITPGPFPFEQPFCPTYDYSPPEHTPTTPGGSRRSVGEECRRRLRGDRVGAHTFSP